MAEEKYNSSSEIGLGANSALSELMPVPGYWNFNGSVGQHWQAGAGCFPDFRLNNVFEDRLVFTGIAIHEFFKLIFGFVVLAVLLEAAGVFESHQREFVVFATHVLVTFGSFAVVFDRVVKPLRP